MSALVSAVLFARGGFVLFGLLIPLVIVGLVAYGIWELVRSRTPGTAPAGAASGSARALLDERLARGDIDPDDYLRRRALLDGPPPVPAAPTSDAPVPDAPTPPATETPAPAPAAVDAAAPDVTAPTPAAGPSDPVE